jgi:peptidoglycan/LPS O-acetylase OafA/YrhL
MASQHSRIPNVESPNLDFLRAIAVLSVYVFHLLYTLGLSQTETPDGRPDFGWLLGRFGVLIFFVHTSLVLMMSLERMEHSGRPLFSAFYIRRFFRIYPLSMACVALVVLFHLPQSPRVPWFNPDWSTITANFFLCTSLFYKGNVISVLWSLPLEVQMYLVLPFVYLIGKRYRLPGIAVLWLGGVIAAYIQPHIAGRLTIAPFVPCFMAGVASYFVGFGSARRRLPFLAWPLTIAAAAGIFSAFGSGSKEMSWIICLVLGLSAPLFADMQSQSLGRVSAWIARYSYGIYLTHMYALWTAFVVLKEHSLWLRLSVLIALSVGSPVIFYKALEAPMINLGTRLANRMAASESSIYRGWDGGVSSATLVPRWRFAALTANPASPASLTSDETSVGSNAGSQIR